MIKVYKTIGEYNSVFRSLPPNQKLIIYKFRKDSFNIWYQTLYQIYTTPEGKLSDKECK